MISHAVALAPFSQNSNGLGLAGLGQAQLTQSNPPGLFCSVMAVKPLTGMPSLSRIPANPLIEPQPPEGAV